MNCPICHQPLHKENRTWKCPNNHAFDQARQGYVNLCRKQKVTGDNEAMSAARTRFLESGAYDFYAKPSRKRSTTSIPECTSILAAEKAITPDALPRKSKKDTASI
ncbi:putative RNA methyltransferase [Allobaculum sp. Allo2]|uniref:putative RNA methyltransferase n=1 Tax=Allobaculum sp. Allo2 TaxID=2853432 RepID=UPI00346192A5